MYKIKIDGFFIEVCKSYADMVSKIIGYQLLGKKVEVIQ